MITLDGVQNILIKELTIKHIINENEQTKEIYKLAVRKDLYALKFIINQTDEICKFAFEKDPYTLPYVINQTVENYPSTYIYVKNPSLNLRKKYYKFF
mgnify:CR=1 FL=1